MSQQYSSLMPVSFNPTEHDLPMAFSFINKSGKYPVVIQRAYLKPTQDASSNFLNLELKIVGGEFDGIVLNDRLNIYNQSMKARELSVKKLTAYCTAVGISQAFNDANILVGRQLQVYVRATEEPSRDNPDVKYWQNDVTEQFYADGSELQRGNWGGQQPQQGNFAAQQQAPQGYAQPALAAPAAPHGYAQPVPVAQPAQPVAPQAPAPQQYAPQAPAQPQYAPQAPAAPVAPQAPQGYAQPAPVAPAAPAAPQGGFAPPPAGAVPNFAPPQ